MNFIEEAKKVKWQNISSDEEFAKQFSYWKTKFAQAFPAEHEILKKLEALSLKPEPGARQLRELYKNKKIAEVKKELDIIFSELPNYAEEFYARQILAGPVDKDYIKAIINNKSKNPAETFMVELKPCLFSEKDNWFERTLKNIASFANTQGGVLLIGIRDNGDIQGINQAFSSLEYKHQNTDGYKTLIVQKMWKYFPLYFPNDCTLIDFVEIDKKIVCCIRVKKAKEPVFLKLTNTSNEVFYFRSDSNSLDMLSIKGLSETALYIKKRFPDWT